MMLKKEKYTPEIVEKWAKGIKNGTLDYDAIKERWGARNDYALEKVKKYWASK